MLLIVVSSSSRRCRRCRRCCRSELGARVHAGAQPNGKEVRRWEMTTGHGWREEKKRAGGRWLVTNLAQPRWLHYGRGRSPRALVSQPTREQQIPDKSKSPVHPRRCLLYTSPHASATSNHPVLQTPPRARSLEIDDATRILSSRCAAALLHWMTT